MLTQKSKIAAAQALGIELAALEATAHVESRANGFGASGRPIILFEPHVFWKELERRAKIPEDYLLRVPGPDPAATTINPRYVDILYPKWGTRDYPVTQELRYQQLERAKQLDEVAAYSACSWGRFQIMGFNWKACGCQHIDEFVEMMHRDDDAHLTLFTHFLLSTGLARHLRLKPGARDLEMGQVVKFVEGYNGKGYKKNHYDTKWWKAYWNFKKIPLK